MAVSYLKQIFGLLILVLVQVLVLNHIHIGGYATPFVYVYFLLVLGCNVRRNTLLLTGFFLGLLIDMFSNTPGMNAAATTFLAFIRPSILKLFIPRDSAEDFIPSGRSMGFLSFLGYVLVAVLIHHTILLLIDTFSFFSWKILLLKILCSTLLTTCCVVVLGCMRHTK